MQLVTIRHYQCNEYSCSSWVLAPDDWSKDDIIDKLAQAQDEYILMLSQAMKLKAEIRPPSAYSFPQWVSSKLDTDPDKTISQLRKEYDEINGRYKEFLAKQEETRTPFLKFLEQQGFVSLYSDTAEPHVVEVSADWGHRHGWGLDYVFEPQDLDKMPTPAKVIELALQTQSGDFEEDDT